MMTTASSTRVSDPTAKPADAVVSFCHVVSPQNTELQAQIDAAYDRLLREESRERKRTAERNEWKTKVAATIKEIADRKATERSVTLSHLGPPLSRPVRPHF